MNQTKFTISEVAKLYKKSRNTIHNDLKKGKLSKTEDDLIDLTELLRVYGAVPRQDDVVQPEYMQKEQKSTQADVLIVENEQLKKQLKMMEQQLDHHIQREQWLQQQISELMQKKIEYQPERKRGFLGRLLG
jgi:predicted transcriptional regulator